MSLRKQVLRLALAGAVFSVGESLLAQGAPPAAPVGPAPTLWHYLGMRQGSWQMRDNFLNRRGNRPNRERTPPLKRIADPSLAEVDNAAIKKAQQIKAEEELAPQKIKAIKYLATLGCEKCYGGIEEAMLESLKDCTEVVRYETVLALQSIPNAECPMCDNDCCTEKMTEQLAKMAYERDPDHPDCWFEPSARVREAAAEAIGVCCPNRQAPPMATDLTPGNGGMGQQGEGPIEGGGTQPPPPPTPPRSAAKQSPKTAGRAKYSIFDSLTASKTAKRPTQARRKSANGSPATATAQAKPPSVWIGDESDATPATPVALPSENSLVQPEDEEAQPLTSVSDTPVLGETTLVQPTEEPVLESIIRQPSNLTRRAQRPALTATAPEASIPRGVLQQPNSIKAPVRRISAEEPVFEEPSEGATATAADETLVATPEQPVSITTETPAATAKATDAGKSAKGTVAKVNSGAGVVQLRFPGGTKPEVGSRVQVHHRYLMKTALVGELEIVAVGSDMITARAVDNTNLSKIGSGDVVTLVTR